jgi:hypothetical protein
MFFLLASTGITLGCCCQLYHIFMRNCLLLLLLLPEFRRVADVLLEGVPGLELATDIIAGFPGEGGGDGPAACPSIYPKKQGHCPPTKEPTRLLWVQQQQTQQQQQHHTHFVAAFTS